MESIKELRKICQRSEHVTHLFFPLFFRIFSIYLTWIFLHFKSITPNKITAIWAVVFFLGSLCYIRGEYWLNLVGISFILLFLVLDLTDGEVARYRKMVSRAGATFFDPATHDFQYAILFPMLAVGVYRFSPDPTILVLGFSAALFKVLIRLIRSRYIRLMSDRADKPSLSTGLSQKNPVKKLMTQIHTNLESFHGIIPLLLVATILDKIHLIVIFYGIMFPLVYFAKAIQCVRIARKLK